MIFLMDQIITIKRNTPTEQDRYGNDKPSFAVYKTVLGKVDGTAGTQTNKSGPISIYNYIVYLKYYDTEGLPVDVKEEDILVDEFGGEYKISPPIQKYTGHHIEIPAVRVNPNA